MHTRLSFVKRAKQKRSPSGKGPISDAQTAFFFHLAQAQILAKSR